MYEHCLLIECRVSEEKAGREKSTCMESFGDIIYSHKIIWQSVYLKVTTFKLKVTNYFFRVERTNEELVALS